MKNIKILLLAIAAISLTACPDDDDTPDQASINLEFRNTTSRNVVLAMYQNGAETTRFTQSGSGVLTSFADFDIDGDISAQLNADSVSVVYDGTRQIGFTAASGSGIFNRSNYIDEGATVAYLITEALYNQADPIDPASDNSFTIGGVTYPLVAGVRSSPYQDNPVAFATNVFLYGSGISLDANEDLTGTGDILAIILYGSNSREPEMGSYNIDDAEMAGACYVLYGADFDTGSDLLEDEVLFGDLDLSRNGNNFTITAQGGPGGFSMSWSGVINVFN